MRRALAALGRSLAGSRRGNIAIVAAASLPLVLGSLALGVDWGYLSYQKRDAQADTDLAAISAASDPAAAAQVLREYVARNGLGLAVMEESLYEESHAGQRTGGSGVLTYRLGHYAPAPEISHEDRFVPDQAPYNAVRVSMHKRAMLAFAGAFVAPPRLDTQAIAGIEGIAAFSIGSRLASLDGGVLNAVLGGLLGSQISLSAMDYRALLDADVELPAFLDTVANALHVEAGRYDELLETNLPVKRLLALLADAPGLSGKARGLIGDIAASASDRSVALSALFDLDGLTGAGDAGLDATVGVLDLVSAVAALSNGDHQVDLSLGAGVPGLASLSVSLLVGERPAHSAWFAVGRTGTVVRTAQTRLKIDASIGGRGLLSDVRVHLPVYLELAFAEGELAEISCRGGASDNAEVDVAARPGVAEAWIEDLPDDLATAGGGRSLQPATLVVAPLLKVSGHAHARIGNPRSEMLHFTARDIREGRVLSTATSAYVAPLVASLLGDLQLDVDLLGLPLVSTAFVKEALSDLIAGAAKPLDSALYSVLLALGVRIGEADIRVTGARCGRPVLVQ